MYVSSVIRHLGGFYFLPIVNGAAMTITVHLIFLNLWFCLDICPGVRLVDHMCVLVAQSCPTLCNPMDGSPPGSSVHIIPSQGKNTGMGSHSLLQGIFLTQASNLGLLH